MTPMISSEPPSGVKSKSANGVNPFRSMISLTSRLGGVPISVIRPPSKVA